MLFLFQLVKESLGHGQVVNIEQNTSCKQLDGFVLKRKLLDVYDKQER